MHEDHLWDVRDGVPERAWGREGSELPRGEERKERDDVRGLLCKPATVGVETTE